MGDPTPVKLCHDDIAEKKASELEQQVNILHMGRKRIGMQICTLYNRCGALDNAWRENGYASKEHLRKKGDEGDEGVVDWWVG